MRNITFYLIVSFILFCELQNVIADELKPTIIPKLEGIQSLKVFPLCYGLSSVKSLKLKIKLNKQEQTVGNNSTFNIARSTQFGVGCIVYPIQLEYSLSESSQNLPKTITDNSITYNRISLRVNQTSIGFVGEIVSNLMYISIGLQDNFVEWTLYEKGGVKKISFEENILLAWIAPSILISNSIYFNIKWEKSFSSESIIQSTSSFGVHYYRPFL